MQKEQIKRLIVDQTRQDGLTETGLPGVQFFRATAAMPCVPAVYDPSIVAIVSGRKEAVLDGTRYLYDDTAYLCCPMSMPVKAGTPDASPDNPLYGVLISLNPRVMTALALEMDAAGGVQTRSKETEPQEGIKLAPWDARFSEALLRLLQLTSDPTDRAVLADARLRELYYAVLTGAAGRFARDVFGPGNAIARSIVHLASHLDAEVSIDDLARRAGMSRAAFHRKFKQATRLPPIQFVKSMRLNTAAMRIAEGAAVSEAAREVGYVSNSQFSRDFRRTYGQSPRQWSAAQVSPTDAG